MAATICIPLYSRPAWELNRPERSVTPTDLIRLRDSLHHRLTHAAGLLERLADNGWEATVDADGLTLAHPALETAARVRRRLRALGIDPNLVEVEELAGAFDVGVGD
jgi:hypothetical protein